MLRFIPQCFFFMFIPLVRFVINKSLNFYLRLKFYTTFSDRKRWIFEILTVITFCLFWWATPRIPKRIFNGPRKKKKQDKKIVNPVYFVHMGILIGILWILTHYTLLNILPYFHSSFFFIILAFFCIRRTEQKNQKEKKSNFCGLKLRIFVFWGVFNDTASFWSTLQIFFSSPLIVNAHFSWTVNFGQIFVVVVKTV